MNRKEKYSHKSNRKHILFIPILRKYLFWKYTFVSFLLSPVLSASLFHSEYILNMYDVYAYTNAHILMYILPFIFRMLFCQKIINFLLSLFVRISNDTNRIHASKYDWTCDVRLVIVINKTP